MASAAQLAIKISARDDASRELAKVGASLGTLQTASTRAALALAAVGVAGAGLGAAIGLKMNAQLEQLKIGFTTLLGSAKAADEQLRAMKEFAARTPFEFQGLADNVRLMTAVGFAAKDTIPILGIVGDQIAAMGAGQESLNRVIVALGQMRSAGRVNAQDMMQLTSAGIAAWDLLAVKIGKSVAETRKLAEEGGISSGVAITAMLEGMAAKSAGAMERQSQTFQGGLSTIRDNFSFAFADITETIFASMRDATVTIANFTSTPAFKQMVEDAATIFGQFINWLKNTAIPVLIGAIRLASAEWVAMGNTAQTVILGLAGLLVVSGPLIGGLKILAGALATAGKVGVIAFGALAAAAGSPIIVPVLATAAAIAIVITTLDSLLRLAGQAFESAGRSVAAFGAELSKTGLPVISDIGSALRDAGNGVKGFGATLQNETAPAVAKFRNELPATIANAVGLDKAADALGKTFDAITTGPIDALFSKLGDEGRKSIEAFQIQMSLARTDEILMGRDVDELTAKLRRQIPTFPELAAAGKAAGSALKNAGISVQEMASALANAHPAIQLMRGLIAGLKDQFQSIQGAIKGAQTHIQGLRDQLAGASANLSNLQGQLSAAQQKLSGLATPRLVGMGESEEQMRAVERAMQRIRFLQAGGTLTEDMMPTPEEIATLKKLGLTFGTDLTIPIEDFQRALERLQLSNSLKFDEPLRKIKEAAEGVKKEMTFDAVIQQIASTKGQIAFLEGAVLSAANVISGLQGQIALAEAGLKAMQEAAALLQQQIADNESLMQLMIKALMDAAIWYLEDREKINAMGGAAKTQAGVVDEKTRALLKAFTGFSQGETSATLMSIASIVEQWRAARDEINRLAGSIQMPARPSAGIGGNTAAIIGVSESRASSANAIAATKSSVNVTFQGPVFGWADLEEHVVRALDVAESRGRR